MANLIGDKPNQVPTHGHLGEMAYQDRHISVESVTLNGNTIGGTKVRVDDDSVVEVVPPRMGGFMFITAFTSDEYPQGPITAALWFDVGASLVLHEKISAPNLDVVITDLNGTTGTDGNVTVSAQSGVLKIENRYASGLTLNLTFL